jgi:hypothetical protein
MTILSEYKWTTKHAPLQWKGSKLSMKYQESLPPHKKNSGGQDSSFWCLMTLDQGWLYHAKGLEGYSIACPVQSPTNMRLSIDTFLVQKQVSDLSYPNVCDLWCTSNHWWAAIMCGAACYDKKLIGTHGFKEKRQDSQIDVISALSEILSFMLWL